MEEGRGHGPWTIHASRAVYHDPFLDLFEDRVTKPDGSQGTYSTVAMKPGVAVLAIDGDDVCMVTQFRYAIGRDSLEAICGGVEPGQQPLAAAQRETREELGIEAREWQALPALDLDTSMVRCPVHLFIASGLTFGRPEREGTEVMEMVRLPLQEAVAMARDGRITHAPTVVLLLTAGQARR